MVTSRSHQRVFPAVEAAVGKIAREGGASNGKSSGKNYSGNQSKQKAVAARFGNFYIPAPSSRGAVLKP